MVTLRFGVAPALLLPLLSACAGQPIAQAFLLPPGIAPGASTYAINLPADEASRAALPFVEQQLSRRGFHRSATPDLIVTVSVSERGRGVGALSPDACNPSHWMQNPGRKWVAGGGRAVGLHLVMVDARTRLPVYRSSASVRTSGGPVENHVRVLAAAALPDDPRRAPACSAAG